VCTQYVLKGLSCGYPLSVIRYPLSVIRYPWAGRQKQAVKRVCC
jgi:hypothetical protein